MPTLILVLPWGSPASGALGLGKPDRNTLAFLERIKSIREEGLTSRRD